MLALALFYEDPQKDKVSNPSKGDFETNVHQEICQEMVRVSEDIYPAVHSEPPSLVLSRL